MMARIQTTLEILRNEVGKVKQSTWEGKAINRKIFDSN